MANQSGICTQWSLTSTWPYTQSPLGSVASLSSKVSSGGQQTDHTDCICPGWLQDPVVTCTALACGAPCSMPVKHGHWTRRTCSACNATSGPWSYRSAESSQRCGQGKVKRATGKASARGPWPHFEREKASLIWACGVFEWCNQNSIWYADWRQAGGREAQANMEETDRERLPWVEAHHSWPSRKEHLEIRCEICYACS